jgi:hypothetical protein
MSGSREHKTRGASELPSRLEGVVNLATANRMTSLLERIVGDYLKHRRCVAELQSEQERLDRHRRDLSWPERSRRYELSEVVANEEQYLLDSLAELEVLGVALVDEQAGQVGIPTLVNDRPAYFSWIPGEESVGFWHFADEVDRRPIPAAWVKQADLRLTGKR